MLVRGGRQLALAWGCSGRAGAAFLVIRGSAKKDFSSFRHLNVRLGSQNQSHPVHCYQDLWAFELVDPFLALSSEGCPLLCSSACSQGHKAASDCFGEQATVRLKIQAGFLCLLANDLFVTLESDHQSGSEKTTLDFRTHHEILQIRIDAHVLQRTCVASPLVLSALCVVSLQDLLHCACELLSRYHLRRPV